MSARKAAHQFDPDCLSASRSRRPNAGVPRQPFDAVNDLLEQRTKRANKEAKASAAAEIEADPLNGDDSPERGTLGKFIPPARTDDAEADQLNYDAARTEYLVQFIATRDGLDVRPDINSGKMDLADLEEMFEDPEAAADAEPDADDPSTSNKKGKSKAAARTNNQGEGADDVLLAPTAYDGITMDEFDHIIKPKYAPKNKAPPTQQHGPSGKKRTAEQGETPRKVSRRGAAGPSQAMSGLRVSSTGGSNTPLSRTDSTTVLDGRPLAHPNFSREAVSSAAGTCGSGSNSNRSHGTQSSSAPKGPTAATVSHRQVPGAQHNTTPKNLGTRPSTQVASTAASNKQVTGPTRPAQGTKSVVPAPTTPARPSAAGGQSRQKAPAEQRQPAERSRRNNADEVIEEDVDPEDQEEEEMEADEPAKKPKRKNTGKPYIKTFPEEDQPIVRMMAGIARARSLANGTYDDQEPALCSKYPDYPEDWEQRKSRTAIVMESLKKACQDFNVDIPFIPRHVQCVGMLITTRRTLDLKAMKSLVTQFFRFTIEESDRNKLLSEKLLPFNFHWRDIPNKRGPFENVLLKYAVRILAFDSTSAIGVRYSEHFEGLPPPFFAYVCALLHHVIFAYRKGYYNNDVLNVGSQTSAFRRALRYMIETQRNKPGQMFSIRNIIYDYSMDLLAQEDDVRSPSPEPEREWTPDTTEPYVSRYVGNHKRVGPSTRDDDMEMGEPEEDA
ncbi:hypothetical protein FRC09_010961 [Ceratobasidium sp. 395]|nr:hypothetical protein FRC09_010961 [Ceratobasidium sp. 395]